MTVTINGSTGISSPGGDTSTSLSTGLLTVTGSTVPANGMYLPAANTLAWATNSTRNMTLDASGNLGIGTSSPSAYGKFAVVGGSIGVSSATYGAVNLYTGTTLQGLLYADTSRLQLEAMSTSPLTLWTNATERARIDSSGNLLVGTTSVSGTEKLNVSTTSDKVAFFNQSVNTNAYNGIHVQIGSSQNNTSSYHFRGETRGYNSWYLYGNGTTSYSSDQRQKKDIETTRDGYLEDVAKLRVVKYRWLNQDEATPKELGLIAQEVEQVFPGLVQDHELEGVEGTRKVIKHSVMEFILIKAIQELTQRLEALEAK